MYKNFNLTDKERQQIMEMHESHGYKKPINEQHQPSNFKEEQMVDDENPEGDVSEGPGLLGRLLGNTAKKASTALDNLARYNVNPGIISLLSKYGTMVMNDSVRAALKNVETEILIVMNDMKRLKATLPADVTNSRSSFAVADSFLQYEVLRDLRMPKGQTIDLGGLYDGILKANSSLSEVGKEFGGLANTKLSPEQMKMVNHTRVNLQDAMKHMDSAIAGFARK
jgi:hypothetical protein